MNDPGAEALLAERRQQIDAALTPPPGFDPNSVAMGWSLVVDWDSGEGRYLTCLSSEDLPLWQRDGMLATVVEDDIGYELEPEPEDVDD